MTLRPAALAVLFAVPGILQSPTLADILAKAAEYHASYRVRVSGVSLDEEYTLAQLMAGQTVRPVRFKSDLVLLNVRERVLALRDPYKIDSVTLREHTPRILNLLVDPTTQKWDQAQAYAAEQDFRFLSDIIVVLSDPILALQFVSSEMQPNCTFAFEERESLDGLSVTRVGFKEIARREGRFALGTPGDAGASGRLWVDLASGAIVKTELWVTSRTENAVIKVSFAKDPTLDIWLPKKMTATYQWSEDKDVLRNKNASGYVLRMSFEGAGTYSGARYTPVDLSKMRQ